MAGNAPKREHWGSSLGFILAAAGSAVGLGNIWKFPYITGQNGGGAFVLVYLLCIAVIGLPVMLCELTLGRHTQRNPVGAFKQLSPKSCTLAQLIGSGILLLGFFLLCFQVWGWAIVAFLVGFLIFRFGWVLVGTMGVVAGFVILSFYSVVAGWTLGYTIKSATGDLKTDPGAQGANLLAHVLLANVKNAPEDVQAAAKAEDTSAAVQDQKIENAAQIVALTEVEKNFGMKLTELEQEVVKCQTESEDALAGAINRLRKCFGLKPADSEPGMAKRVFEEAFADAVSQQIARDKLIAHLTEHYGGMEEVVDHDGKKQTRFPRKFRTAVAGQQFHLFMDNPALAIGWHFVFMLVCIGIVCMGVEKGIERASKVLMPTLFVLILALIVRGLTLDGAIEGVRFYLSPDFSKLTGEGFLLALGHAFFSLSLGMGAIITYGSYVDREQNIFLSALSITALDTLIALMAGLAIFPAVFAEGFDPAAGPGLVFQTLPAVFNGMPAGTLWATVFFLLLLVAALTSAISLLEVVTAYFVDERKWSRKTATIVFGIVIFALGSLCAISVGDWDRLRWLQAALITAFGSAKGSFFDVMDRFASNWMLPLGGLLISVFVGWVWGTKKAVDEIRHGSHNFADVHLFSLLSGLKDDHSHNSKVHVVTLASVWGIFIRFVSPVAVLIAFMNTIGWIDFSRKAPEPPEDPPAAEKSAEEAPAE
ncbi:MAG: sodium-dependent transporter [Lentisphaerae bacterium]|jgi:SNF family Na+-dependent transporter|nr:sodium-dependent transporter [Lentisphaerota bacterium]MBT4814974.1 sodium-dependent transporter [Lentisphaerota bacterium]MBT5604611.1 sodium-dependent transporter [Lentisphaerota bacterium]MBT7055919.1 sodium-dependent transporter [Lentisphaerota bacterium]MBT7847895.1 sodium-dependent transporter [Lentisphaerota bacterium]